MKVLFIGGTGNISAASTTLAIQRKMDLSLLNRGVSASVPQGVEWLPLDIKDPERVAATLSGRQWDAVVNWIGYEPVQIERDLELFRGKTRQYIFISSAAA
jgi:dTDP-4-dehydrorhamnose reductase